MKASNYMLIAAALVFAACSNENDPADNGPVAAQINAEIGDMTPRASGTLWVNGTDAIGVSVVSVENSGKTTGANVKYNKTAAGWEADSPIYFEDLNEVTFRAYYPFQGESGTDAGTISKTISASDQTTAEQPKIDFMFATGATASKNSPNVSFTGDYKFKHCMSQLTLTFKAGTDVTLPDKLTGYTLKGLIMAGTFNTKTGEAKAKTEGSTTADLSFTFTVNEGDSYTTAPVILYPQSTANNQFDIEVTVEGETFKATLTLPNETNNTFKAGVNLTYTVTINKTGLGISSADIEDWTSVTGTNGTAEML